MGIGRRNVLLFYYLSTWWIFKALEIFYRHAPPVFGYTLCALNLERVGKERSFTPTNYSVYIVCTRGFNYPTVCPNKNEWGCVYDVFVFLKESL